MRIGIDLGSVSAKIAVLDGEGRISEELYRRHHGRPSETLAEMLTDLEGWAGAEAAFTGSASRLAASVAGVTPVNEVVALAAAVPRLCPGVRSVVEMGGQDSKLLLFREAEGCSVFDDFSMNTVCAAGTGSFLDQQATRLGLRPEELGELALQCPEPPRIAGRCSVFAKSDMIHLQQIGTPVSHIVAGLCFAVARNFRSSIASGREFRPPVAFVGGVAANPGMVRAFRETLGSGYTEMVVPGRFRTLTAAGAVFAAGTGGTALLEEGFTLGLLEAAGRRRVSGGQPPLSAGSAGETPPAETDDDGGPVLLGIDVGSISTNLVALSAGSGRVAAAEYLMTAGRPLEAVRTGLARLSRTLGPDREVLAAGTTGSGRYMTADFVGADVVRNEITAQARAALEIDPGVDTVFEIGGQDSKYISLEEGRVVDFEMNKVCAAGTGSFLEEQAERLGLDIREFGPTALESPSPARLGDRCTVFMESDVISHQADGADTGSLVAGLCYSIVRNYLHRVVGDRRVGERILFQGGTAWNRGVVAAFDAVLGERKVTVPPFHHVTGAIGAALLAGERAGKGPSSFRGFGLAGESFVQDTFTCSACPNMCEIHRVTLRDGRRLTYGGRCERYETGAPGGEEGGPPGRNCFPERTGLLLGDYEERPRREGRPRIGIPRMLWFWELFPFFRTFFEECGMDVVLSGPSTSSLVHSGVESVSAETCFPLKLGHGHVQDLLARDVDAVFLPSILRSFPAGGFSESYNCPYVEGSPYVIDAGLGLSDGEETDVLSPVIDLSLPGREWRTALVETVAPLGVPARAAERAADAARGSLERFRAELAALGADAIASAAPDQPVLVMLSRPYNGSDDALNAGLPEKLARLGNVVVPTDCLDLPLERAAEVHENMYWQYGQRILAAAIAVREDPALSGVYLTNFGCGPDSFIQHEVDMVMGGKPMLTIEIDEHAADAGVITRCEAFMDAIRGRRSSGTSPFSGTLGNRDVELGGRTVWVPNLGDGTPIAAAAARRLGVDARPIPETTKEAVALGREVTTGRECYPAIITAGNMLEVLRRNPEEEVAFFMATASGPCRFGQYCSYHRILLDRLGYTDVPIITASSRDSYTSVKCLSSLSFQVDLLRSIIAADTLHRALYRVRPYEREAGAADRVYAEALAALERAMESGSSPTPVMRRAAEEMSAIPRDDVPRPLVLLFGEIYVRNDPFAHSWTDRRIEELGGEVLFTQVLEWFEFVNHTFMARARARRRIGDLLKGFARGRMMAAVRRRLEAPFAELLADRPGPEPGEILEAAGPYMPENVGGEAILCVGAPLALAGRGAISGAVNLFPFTCLPGTIVSAVSKRLRREHGGLPWLNLAFDGQEDTDNGTRLEAFMYQVREGRAERGTAAGCARVRGRALERETSSG